MSSPPPKYQAAFSGPGPKPISSMNRPTATPVQGRPDGNSSNTLRPPDAATSAPTKKKRNNHRGGKKRRNRRQSFVPSDVESAMGQEPDNSGARNSFYMQHGRNFSNTSLESEALLDHREQTPMRPRRSSVMAQNAFNSSYRQSYSQSNLRGEMQSRRRPKTARSGTSSHAEETDMGDERTPLMMPQYSRARSHQNTLTGYGTYGGDAPRDGPSINRRNSSRSSRNSRKRTSYDHPGLQNEEYNVNYPPSIPGSPRMGAIHSQMSFGPDMLLRDDDFESSRPASRGNAGHLESHLLDENAVDDRSSPAAASPHRTRTEFGMPQRRHTIALNAEEDVCFPLEGISEMGNDELPNRDTGSYRRGGARRRRNKKWPDLEVLEEWSQLEKEGRSEERRAKKITEPQLIGGRLRPIHKGWHRAEDDAPYRFTYFNEEFPSTIHSQTISELVQPGGSFRELFVPDPRPLSDSSEDEDDDERPDDSFIHHATGENGISRAPTRQGSLIDRPASRRSTFNEERANTSHGASGQATPNGQKSPNKPQQDFKGKPKSNEEGPRPTWWLDVLSPTESEMKALSKAFGIHPLTAEDILMQEAREKVELFRNYYFVNYRSFEQDMNNEDYLEPVNMYVVVFREGVISFHFSLTPHPANVRRRIRQLKDYLILSSDWISYAIIDDITDVFAPLIQNVEEEVDDIDDAILKLHCTDPHDPLSEKDAQTENHDGTTGESGGDMLRQVGDCRKKVMGLYRLLGHKADVIKGFAKRCNEHWEVAPHSEIGLYLGDIQDHIVTMTGSLSHYEEILARSYQNYVAQINIRMNERQEQTADVLGRLNVLSTIVLPMNIITGLWGMNVWVPGQSAEGDLTWFILICLSLVVFGLVCYIVAIRLLQGPGKSR